MKRTCLTVGLAAVLSLPSWTRADDPVFSGPQVGETLPALPVLSVLGETTGEEIDLVQRAGGKPLLLVFVNGRTRPGFALTNLLMRYAGSGERKDLHSAVIFLTDDATSTQQWVKVVERHFSPETSVYGISKDGQEGPGAYGLNRNVELTILVGKEGRVTANFALVQPSVEADGPKILKAIVDATGGGEVPTIAQLGGDGYRDRAMMRREAQRGGEAEDPRLPGLLRPVIRKNAAPEEVAASVKKVEDYVAQHDVARRHLGRIAANIVKSGKLDNYGTAPAQEALRKWAAEFGPREETKQDAGKSEK